MGQLTTEPGAVAKGLSVQTGVSGKESSLLIATMNQIKIMREMDSLRRIRTARPGRYCSRFCIVFT